MGLNAVLVDRARVHSKAATASRVEGQTVYEPVVGDWFKARLTLQQAPEQNAPTTGAPEALSAPTLMCGPKDTRGNVIVINGQDRIEIISAQLGDALWDVVGDPNPLRKKKRVIGWEVALRRVVTHGTPPL
jgi:hypothetical protein